MKTLADLKRDLVIGSTMTLISRYGQTEGENIGVQRFVVKKNTVGLYLNPDKEAKKGVFLDWPKASLLEYDGQTIKVYIPDVDDDNHKGELGLVYQITS